MTKRLLLTAIVLILATNLVIAQSNQCLTKHLNNLDKLLPVSLVKEYSKNHELDHYINGKGTKYVESQFFWYPTEETTQLVKLYGLKVVDFNDALKKYERRVKKKTDEVYNYQKADGIGDYAFWTTPALKEESASTSDATLTVLIKNERFVVQVDLGDYKKSQKGAIKIAQEILKNCK